MSSRKLNSNDIATIIETKCMPDLAEFEAIIEPLNVKLNDALCNAVYPIIHKAISNAFVLGYESRDDASWLLFVDGDQTDLEAPKG